MRRPRPPLRAAVDAVLNGLLGVASRFNFGQQFTNVNVTRRPSSATQLGCSANAPKRPAEGPAGSYRLHRRSNLHRRRTRNAAHPQRRASCTRCPRNRRARRPKRKQSLCSQCRSNFKMPPAVGTNSARPAGSPQIQFTIISVVHGRHRDFRKWPKAENRRVAIFRLVIGALRTRFARCDASQPWPTPDERTGATIVVPIGSSGPPGITAYPALPLEPAAKQLSLSARGTRSVPLCC
jgi:ribosomal protein L37AE/L43A